MNQDRNNKRNYTKYPLNYSRVLQADIAQSFSNKLQSVPFEEITNPEVLKCFKFSKFTQVRKRLEKKLSKNGEMALAVFKVLDTFFIQEMEIIEKSSIIGNKILDITLSGATQIIVDGTKTTLYTRFIQTSTGYHIVRYYIDPNSKETKMYSQAQTIIGKEIPVVIFENNESSLSDIKNAEVGLLRDFLEKVGNRVNEYFEFSKTMWANNQNFSDETAKQRFIQVMNGARVLEDESFDSKLAQGLSLISPGASEIASITATLEWIEDKIKTRVGLSKESMQNGTNKHGLEVVLKDQFATELLLSKRTIREQQFNDFFELLSNIIGVEIPQVELKISPIEQAKIDLMNAEIEIKQAKKAVNNG